MNMNHKISFADCPSIMKIFEWGLHKYNYTWDSKLLPPL